MIEKNPVVDYAVSIVMGYYGSITITISNEPHVYTTKESLETDYLSGKIHPSDLKPAVTEAINKILEPVRLHFASGEPKALLEKVKKFQVTR